jgi:hypothetical protein
MSPLTFTFPIDGDVLTHLDGSETTASLTVTVRGTAPPEVEVRVNGKVATRDGSAFTCDIAIAERKSTITAACGEFLSSIDVSWSRGSRKRYRFSSDDNIFFLRDLAQDPARYLSLFDHPYLRFWRSLRDEFGTKTHINIYYQCDGFDLTQMPDAWRDEWESNADWLRLTFHALGDQPPRPYRNAGYSQLAHDFDLITGHIRRFAGDAVLSTTTTVHWAECPRGGVRALRDRGIQTLIGLFDLDTRTPDTTYYLSREESDRADTRPAWYDRDTRMMFIPCAAVVNNLAVDDIVPHLDARAENPSAVELLELLIHEQYFREESGHYMPDIEDKSRTAVRWAHERGYEPCFWSDGFLGIED